MEVQIKVLEGIKYKHIKLKARYELGDKAYIVVNESFVKIHCEHCRGKKIEGYSCIHCSSLDYKKINFPSVFLAIIVGIKDIIFENNVPVSWVYELEYNDLIEVKRISLAENLLYSRECDANDDVSKLLNVKGSK